MYSSIIWRAAAIFVLATQAAISEPRDAPPLLDTISLWLVANFDLPVSAEPPNLVSVSDVDLVAMRYGPGSTVAPGTVVAVYDDVAHIIYLSEGWTGRTPAELSVLVHEMVHHLQKVGDMRFACPAERETVAYHAQDEWLGLFGESLQSAFGIGPAMLLIGTVCTY